MTTPSSQITVYLSLGSNLGDRQDHLEEAVRRLPPRLKVTARSSIYETEPWGYTDQPDFLNQVIEGRTSLSPRELLDFLKNMEKEIGRKPGIRYGPRVIDLDILFYGHQVHREQGLVIPHARLSERAFVLVPLAEIAPDFCSPASGKTVREMLAEVDSTGVVPFQNRSSARS